MEARAALSARTPPQSVSGLLGASCRSSPNTSLLYLTQGGTDMRRRRGVFTTAITATALALILACVPSTAFALQVLIAPLKQGATIPSPTANISDVYLAMDLAAGHFAFAGLVV